MGNNASSDKPGEKGQYYITKTTLIFNCYQFRVHYVLLINSIVSKFFPGSPEKM